MNERGISVPDDISVIGINDIDMCAYAGKPLTTIRTFSSERIRIGVKILMDKINNPSDKAVQHTAIQSELIVRETTGSVKSD